MIVRTLSSDGGGNNFGGYQRPGAASNSGPLCKLLAMKVLNYNHHARGVGPQRPGRGAEIQAPPPPLSGPGVRRECLKKTCVTIPRIYLT